MIVFWAVLLCLLFVLGLVAQFSSRQTVSRDSYRARGTARVPYAGSVYFYEGKPEGDRPPLIMVTSRPHDLICLYALETGDVVGSLRTVQSDLRDAHVSNAWYDGDATRAYIDYMFREAA